MMSSSLRRAANRAHSPNWQLYQKRSFCDKPNGINSTATNNTVIDKPTKRVHLATALATFNVSEMDPHGSVNVPIYQTSTFDCRDQSGYDYTRSGNPTRHALEELCRKIEHAHSAFAFTSGMAALSSVVQLLKPGDHVLACEDIYGGMHRLLLNASKTTGVNVHFVKTWETEMVERALRESPEPIRHIYIESPTNPQMKVSNIRDIATLAKNHEALLCIDNSLMSPVLMTPLDLGADIVVHSATKFLAGHSDVMAGVVAVKDPELAKQIAFGQNAHGTGLAPFDCFLVLRGMKTMMLRVMAAQKNAVEVATFLQGHPAVTKVHYLDPANANTDAAAKTHFAQAKGGGSVLSFETGSVAVSNRIVKEASLFKNTVSFGSCSSLIEIPGEMSHASIPSHLRTMPDDLIRLSIGVEDVSDLIADLGNAISIAVQAEGAQGNNPVRENSIRSLPLGVSLPPRDEHAVGVSMPRWEDVVAYEEGCEVTHSKLSGGYPRFVLLKNVKQLFAKAEELFCEPGEAAMVVPSARVALRLQQFLAKANVPESRVHDFFALGVFAVTFPVEHAGTAKLFWQHCGEIVSSRLAAAVLRVVNRTCYENAGASSSLEHTNQDDLDDEPMVRDITNAREGLKREVSNLAQVDEKCVFLYPTGMASITAAHRLLKLSSQWEDTPLPTVVFGFPYLDTLKVSQLAGKCFFFGRGDDEDFEELERVLERETISGLFCEFPSNPLLRPPDLERLRGLADKHMFPIVCDDTVAGFTNVDLFKGGMVDILCSSLTKQFSGSGNVMGGSLILNPHSAYYSKLFSRLVRDYEELLWEEDAAVLLQASWDLHSRTAKSNASTEIVVDLLSSSPLIKDVFYPKLTNAELYDKFLRDNPGAGYGSLFSVVFEDAEHSRIFYDALDVAKGPGFGTNFSMACPYTVIAHYTELEWAQKFGVDKSLVRIWIGQESQDQLLLIFNEALAEVQRQCT